MLVTFKEISLSLVYVNDWDASGLTVVEPVYQLPPPTAVPYDAVTKLGKPLAVQAFEPDAPLNPQQHPITYV